jgi:MFS family permease
MVGVALTLACRDFCGVASFTLTSIYLQKAHGLDAKHAGFILGAMMLVTIVVNPLSVWFSPGRRRLPALAAVLVAGGAIIATTPYWPVALALPVLCAFQACHLGSYAISDAAIMERVDPAVRGRVVGLFLTIAGTIASTSPWVMGAWTDALGARAATPRAYAGPFGLLGLLIALAASSTYFIGRLGRTPAGRQIQAMSETMPATVEPVG